MNKEDKRLRVHVANDGIVWCAGGNKQSTCTGETTNAFIQSLFSVKMKYTDVRVMGWRTNAKLLIDFFDALQTKAISSLQICSPLAVQQSSDRDDPSAVLNSLLRWEGRQPSQGGWRSFTKDDRTIFSMISESDDSVRVSMLKTLPMFRYMSFVHDMNLVELSKLVALVVDPRFYIDSMHPDRGSKLEAYLGLTKSTQAGVFDDSKPKGKYHNHCELVLNTWKVADRPPKDYTTKPSCFLWRIWTQHACGLNGDLKASQNLCAFLRHTWLDSLYPNLRKNDSLFVPELFFKTTAECDAFKLHMDSNKDTVDSGAA